MVKKPKWDNCDRQGVSGGTFPNIDEPLKKGMTITGKFKGKNINMRITDVKSSAVFEAEIIDIEQNATTHDDLSIGDIVEISREFVCWHHVK